MGVGGVGAPQRTRDSSLDCWHFLGHFPAAGHPELCGFLLPPAGEKTRGDTQHWDQTRGDGWGHTPPPTLVCPGRKGTPGGVQDTGQVT